MSSSSEIEIPTLDYKPPVELIASTFVDVVNAINTYSQKFGSISNSIEDVRKVSAGVLVNERTPTQIKQLYNICDTIQELRNIITRDSETKYNALPKSLRDEYSELFSKRMDAIRIKDTITENTIKKQLDILRTGSKYQYYLKFNKQYDEYIEHFKKNATFTNQTKPVAKASEPKEKKTVIKEKDPVILEEIPANKEDTDPTNNTPLPTNSVIDDSTDLLLLDLNMPSVPAPFIPETVVAEPDTDRALHNRKKNIPKHIKTMVWNVHVGVDKLETKCFSCRAEKIDARHFQCGHVIAEAKGGDLNIKNLRPICQPCNASMGTQSMNEFTQEYFGWNVS